MESKVKAFGHPIHPTLIVFPLGLLATAVVFDVIRILTGNPTWSHVAFYMIPAGIIGGLAAAVFGLVDWLAITPDTPRRLAATSFSKRSARSCGSTTRP